MNFEQTLSIMLKGVAQHTETEEIIAKLKSAAAQNRPLRVKLGLDPTAPDIHLGHAVVLRKLRQLQDLGHTAVIIIGDFTGMIGDPTGKSKTRRQLSAEEVQTNAKTYENQIFRILRRERTEMCFNSAWLAGLTFADVINLASKTTVARILERDDFTKRFGEHRPIALHEFFYPLMQAYDSVAVKADVELGGTDQVFNILMGRNIQKDFGQPPQITLFMPLLCGTDGVEKMSKSQDNYIGIFESAGVMFEKVMKIPDGLIMSYYDLCTDMTPEAVSGVRRRMDGGANPRDIKMELAKEIVSLYHAEADAAEAEKNFKLAFQKGALPSDAPIITVSAENASGALLDELLKNGAFKSKSEIRRLFEQGAASVNGRKTRAVSEAAFSAGDNVVQIGKGRFFLVRVI